MQIKIDGIEKLSSIFEKIDFEKNGERVVKKVAMEINKQAKFKTPVRTSRLIKGWRVKKSGNLQYTICNNVEYASHVEYGHRIKGKDGKKSSKMVPGRFMLRDAINEVSPKFIEMIKDGIFK